MRTPQKYFTSFLVFQLILLILLGSWWVYLLFSLTRQSGLSSKFSNMLIWEGGTFFVLICLITATLFYLYLKDAKKTKAFESFFASLNHELKTPLAGLKLQTEVLNEYLGENSFNPDNKKEISELIGRMLGECDKLENDLDKLLQLSKVERRHLLNMEGIELSIFLSELFSKWSPDIKLNFSDLKGKIISADHFALQVIFRNLIENSKKYAKSKDISIECHDLGDKIEIKYSDKGEYTGDPKNLGKLFYSHSSDTGSGIGLYLVKNLTKQMKGQAKFQVADGFSVYLQFLKQRPRYA